MCWPRVGGGILTPGVACEYLMGVFTSLTGPQAGCSTSVTISRAWTMAENNVYQRTCWGLYWDGSKKINSPCEWFRVPWISFTAAYGIPLPSKISSHSWVVFCLVVVSIKLSISSRCFTRSLFVVKRASVFHSGYPN